MKAAVSHHDELIKILKDPQEASAYLNAALEAGDKKAFLMALRNVLEAHGGMTRISDRAKINRVSLYKMLSRDGNPGFENLLTLLNVVGIRFQVTARPKSRRRAA
ncbi:MAG: transcriptional regulator [Omnitrophica bacterium RIFCSPLOWO2_01_FULL_50_24]|nr:MAG: transcriptional regulator [Omnitrophica bacterium RIFCSPLOWO2_01_FULL_50_24]